MMVGQNYGPLFEYLYEIKFNHELKLLNCIVQLILIFELFHEWNISELKIKLSTSRVESLLECLRLIAVYWEIH